MRFYDHSSKLVSVAEFIDYFITPAVTRQAKSASSAVRGSLQMLDIVNELGSVSESTDTAPINVATRMSGSGVMRGPAQKSPAKSASGGSGLGPSGGAGALPSSRLELALLKLVTMWGVVEHALVRDNLYFEEIAGGAASPTVDSGELKVSCRLAVGDALHCIHFFSCE